MQFFPMDWPTTKRINGRNIALALINAAGMILYLVIASRGWRNPQEHGMIPVTGEPFVWAEALPVLGIFFLADVIWGGLLLRYKEWRGKPWWLGTAVVWLLVISIDFYHH
jgi:hypothetical protein